MLEKSRTAALQRRDKGEDLALPQSVVISAPWQVVLTLPASAHLLERGETDRMTRFVRAADADRFCAAHSLVRLALSAVTGQLPAALEFLRHPRGKPYLKGIGGLDFNLSHSGDWVVVGICFEGVIGVDVEEMRPEDFWREMTSSFMTQVEIAHIPPHADGWHFLRLWTAKEAALKASGDGFVIPPNQIAIEWNADRLGAVIAGRRMAGHVQALDAAHLLAVMTDGGDAPAVMIARDKAELQSALANLRAIKIRV